MPESIGQLTQLGRLNVSSNQLTASPDSIGRLSQFQKLDLSSNELTALPDSLRTLGSLKELYLHGNDALGRPTEVLGPTWDDVDERKALPAKPGEILDYYFRVQGGKRPLNEAKLILVGRGAVGKTSIVNRLVYNRFDKDEKKAEGINITEWKIRLHEKGEVRLNIDFIKTDCKDGTGINELKKAIERETDRLEDLRQAFPASWFAIKDQLAALKENYLSFEDYRLLDSGIARQRGTQPNRRVRLERVPEFSISGRR